MRARCNKPYMINYERYGGRGIAVCSEWNADFWVFFAWAMCNGYQDHLTIDRIDNNAGYSPSNCRWSTLEEQGRNKRSNAFITAFEETKTIKDWTRDPRCAVTAMAIYQRIKHRGFDPESAISRPWQRFRKNTHISP